MNESEIVNVASVLRYSPFRCPGGKTWLVPHLRRWLNRRPEKPAHHPAPGVMR